MRKQFGLEMLMLACFLAAYLTVQIPAQAPMGGPPPGGGPGGPQGMTTVPLNVHQLSPAAYWAQGSGGNTGFIVGDKGVIVIDTTMSTASARDLLDNIAKITPKPVNMIMLTHGDFDHVGGLGGFPASVAIYAQENNTKRMEAGVAIGKSPVPVDKLPNHSVRNNETVVADGVKMELLHWAPAHTDGDLVIFLPEQKIVFTGDIFTMNQPRALIHREQMGTSEGWITTAKGILALNADLFVVGHGDVQTKQGLEDRVTLVETEREQIKAMVAQGKSLAEIEVAVGDPPPGSVRSGPGPHFTPFSEVVYQELTEKK